MIIPIRLVRNPHMDHPYPGRCPSIAAAEQFEVGRCAVGHAPCDPMCHRLVEARRLAAGADHSRINCPSSPLGRRCLVAIEPFRDEPNLGKPGPPVTSVATLLPCIRGRYSPIRRVGAAVPCAGSAWCRRQRSPSVSGLWSWRWPGGRRLRSPTGLLRAPPRPRRTTAVRPGPRLAARRACRHPARGRGSHCRPRRPPAPRPLRLAVLRPSPPPLTRRWAVPRHRSPPIRPAALRPGTPGRRAREAPMASSPPGPASADPYQTGAPGPSRRASRARPSSHRRSRAPHGHWVLVSLVMLVFAAGLTVEIGRAHV